MKEIKFRAWDKNEKAWITEPVGFTMSVVDGKFHIFGFDDAFADMYQVRIDLQQYTGLKDKNGKEIYEGDIVNIYPNTSKTYKVVEWDNHYGGYNIFTYESNEPNEVELIGNIYENPELLKQWQ